MLSGEIPAELGNLTSLQVLSLWGNELSEKIPAELGNLTSLLKLDLAQNDVERGDPGGAGESDQPRDPVSLGQ